VLGCLVEKQLTTPQQYPLTLNALTMAANQATNRDPVVTLDDETVLAALDELRSHHLVRVLLPSHGRSVKRYRHVIDEVYGLDTPRYALLATLLLRGPQTVGELRARSERMVDFPSVGDAQEQLEVLAEHSEGLANLLPRRPGQKEDRWQQIVATPWSHDTAPVTGDDRDRDQSSALDEHALEGGTRTRNVEDESGASNGRARASDFEELAEFEELRSELASLRLEVAALRDDIDELRQALGG
jgi:uncharacterized protein YceH (UPF0502 family)